ncbi:MAG: hypothetical protein HYY84_19345 [Deltaproteobacteria bacterium]|nr:hypothetical protein [Deltaproteobacteria bacterium]
MSSRPQRSRYVRPVVGVFLVTISIGCKSTVEAVSYTIQVTHELPDDFLNSIRSSIAQIDLLIDERPGQGTLFEADSPATPTSLDDGRTATKEIGDLDGDNNREFRLRTTDNAFSNQLSWVVFLRGAPLRDTFHLKGMIYSTIDGGLQLVAEATATGDQSGAALQFTEAQRTARLVYDCAPNVNCRLGAPDTTLSFAPATMSNNPVATFVFSCSAPPCTFACQIDDGGLAPCISPLDAGAVGDGPHTFAVRATSDAGLTDPTPATHGWTVDTAPPLSVVAASDGGPFSYGVVVPFGGTAIDGIAGVARVEVSVDGGGNWFDAIGTNAWSSTFTATRFMHRLLSRATDDAGNVETPDGGVSFYTSGIPATQLIGPYGGNSTAICPDNPGNVGLNRPTGAVFSEWRSRLFVADTSNNRVLVYTMSGGLIFPDYLADFVFGQPNMSECRAAEIPSAATMSGPYGLVATTNPYRLFVSDEGNNRILVFDITEGSSPFSTGMNAQFVIGQPNFSGRDAGGGATGLNRPKGLAHDSTVSRLYVADSLNHRVVVFSTTELDSGVSAVSVLGQADFDGGRDAGGPTGLSSPSGVAIDTTRQFLFVADRMNHRVVVFDVAAIANGEAATNVLGQTSLDPSAPGGTSATQMNEPVGVAFQSSPNRLYVADSKGNRVMVFDTSSIDAGEAAINVIGQQTLTSKDAGFGTVGLSAPLSVHVTPTSPPSLLIGDTSNHRIQVFDVAAVTANAADASTTVGHIGPAGVPDFAAVCANGMSASTLGAIFSFAFDAPNRRLFVAEHSAYRVLSYDLNTSFLLADSTAESVIGQPDFASCPRVGSQNSFRQASGLAYDSATARLFVSDFGSRVLVFNLDGGIVNGMNAESVLGKSDYTSTGDTASTGGLADPTQLAYHGGTQRLFVPDVVNNRIMIWEFDGGTVPMGSDAKYVLGQPDYVSTSPGTLATQVANPWAAVISSDGKTLYVSDSSNNRVLVYDLSAGITNGQSAAFVVGQAGFGPGFTDAGTGATGLASPIGLALDDVRNRLYVGDFYNNRVVVYRTPIAANLPAAINVIGQPDLLGKDAGTSQSRFSTPLALALDPNGQYLYVSDFYSWRSLVFDVGP